MVNMTSQEAYYKCQKKKDRILELEEIISSDPQYSFLYANHIVKNKWELGEKAISTHSYFSYRYARFILRNVFPLCHPIVFSSPFKDDYIDFLKSINYDFNEISEWLI